MFYVLVLYVVAYCQYIINSFRINSQHTVIFVAIATIHIKLKVTLSEVFSSKMNHDFYQVYHYYRIGSYS